MTKTTNTPLPANERDLLAVFFGKNFEPLSFAQPNSQLFYFVNNPDGTIRWAFPATCSAPTLLSLYNSSGWRGAVVRIAIRTAFLLKNPKLIAAGCFWAAVSDEKSGSDFAIFTGTVGVNRKLVVSHGGLFFEKIPCAADAKWLIGHERTSLDRLAMLGLEKIHFPTAEKTERGGILLNNVRPTESLPAAELTELHRAALHELALRTGHSVRLEETIFFQKILKNLRAFDACPANDFTEKMIPLRALLAEILESLNPDEPLVVGLAHGDFTPWNCFLPKKQRKTEQKLSGRMPHVR